MLKKHLTAYVAATALLTAAAVAQTSPAAPGANQPATSGQPATTTMQPATGGQQPSMSAPNQSQTMSGSTAAATGQILTQMSPEQMRGSKIMGVDVYGSDNQKIGDIDELILSQDGRIEAIVVGVGGFLGIGEKNVAIPFDQVEFMTETEVQAMTANNQTTTGATTAGGVTTPAAPATTGSTNQPATGMATAGANTSADDNEPERAMVKMTRADLQNAPQFRYAGEANRTGGAGNTNPPASTTAPATAPQ